MSGFFSQFFNHSSSPIACDSWWGAKLEVLKFAHENFSFHWTKEGSTEQIEVTNVLTFQSVCEKDLGYYRCEVKEAGRVVLTVYRALYRDTDNIIQSGIIFKHHFSFALHIFVIQAVLMSSFLVCAFTSYLTAWVTLLVVYHCQ